MKGIIGTHMKYKGFIVPRGGKLVTFPSQLLVLKPVSVYPGWTIIKRQETGD